MAELIHYNGESKVIRRICELLNNEIVRVMDVHVNGESVVDETGVAQILVPLLGDEEGQAYPGNLGKEAHDHSLVIEGNPHHVTAEDLGLGNVLDQLHAIMETLGLSWSWITQANEHIVDHNGDRIVFHGVGMEDTQNLLWH